MGSAGHTRKISLIVGLGNPGDRYHETRHNLGFRVVDLLTEELRNAKKSRYEGSEVFDARRRNRRVLCLKPGRYMNLSGGPTARAAMEFEVDPEQILVVHDDLDLPPGKLRLRKRGGSGGHRGVEDIIEELGRSDFHRLRIGIGRPQGQITEEYVLENCAPEEAELLTRASERAVEACLSWLDEGIVLAMDRFNRDE